MNGHIIILQCLSTISFFMGPVALGISIFLLNCCCCCFSVFIYMSAGCVSIERVIFFSAIASVCSFIILSAIELVIVGVASPTLVAMATVFGIMKE